MTLITYITRVHFADGILEEALRSELEVNNKKRPFLLLEDSKDPAYSETLDRLYEGIPDKNSIETFEYKEDLAFERVVHEIAGQYDAADCDILLAFGSNNIIDLGKLARVAIAHKCSLSRFTIAEGGSRWISEKMLPDFYAVPNIFGFCSAVSAHTKLVQENGVHARLMCRKLVPTVTICDPTITSDAGKVATASTGVDAISRCLEAYLSPNYNPPADGIAYDGLRRALEFLPKTLQDEQLEYRRELMAASLNSALALQKGLGTTQVIGDGVHEACKKHIELGTIRRIILPKVVDLASKENNEKVSALANLFAAKDNADLPDAIDRYFNNLPLGDCFKKLGIESEKIPQVATIASNAMLLIPGLETLGTQSIEDMMTGTA